MVSGGKCGKKNRQDAKYDKKSAVCAGKAQRRSFFDTIGMGEVL